MTYARIILAAMSVILGIYLGAAVKELADHITKAEAVYVTK